MTTPSVLDEAQLGHLRHWDNLSRRLPHDWSQMQGKGAGEDDFGSYRFQLAYMVYGLALTHRHRLPAAPGLFRPTIQRLIEKLLMPDVWMYWRDASRGGMVANAHLVEGLHEEWDPVVRDNIMYSAYVQSCSLLHDHLFADDRYAQPESLTFAHWSFFWGGEEKRFAYDRESLNEHLYWQMVENGYLGIACEPNCVFQICNQPAILGFRLHDAITGGSRADEVVAGYQRAWADFGRLDDTGHYNQMILEDSKVVAPNALQAPWVDAWCGALMNTWNREFVHEHYPRQVADFLVPGPDGTISVRSTPVMNVMGHTVVNDTCDMGWVAAWAAEMGDRATLDGILAHADRFMAPTWADGGLYYPRNDDEVDADGNRTGIEPMTGNVLLGYARLDIPDGLHELYQHPWGPEHFTEPALVEVGRDVEVSRAEVLDGVLHARLRRRGTGDSADDGTVVIGRVPDDARVRVDGREVETRRVPEVVQFGFTSCRVVCPRALTKLTAALDGLDEAVAARVRPLYVSVDPERDTPEVMREFLTASYPRFTGLTGTPEQVEAAKRAFRVFARRRPDPADPDGYAVPHTAITYLVDPAGQLARYWPDTVEAPTITADLTEELHA